MNRFKLRRRIDASIPIIGLSLSVFGLVMILSASQITAANAYGNQYYFFSRQLISWLIGLAGFVYFLRVPLDHLYERRLTLLICVLVGLLLVFMPVIGPKIAGVHRWINLGVFLVQPAEFAKLLLLIYLSAFFAERTTDINDPFRSLFPFIILMAVVGFLVIIEPDLGTTLVILLTCLTVFFVAKANLFQFVSLLAVGIVVILLLINIAPYRANRLKAFLNKGTNSADNLGASYHSNQALIAVGSGGLWGVGFGQGISKYAYLPEAYTDSIFAVIAEELGFFRTSLIILAYLYLAWRGVQISQRGNSRFVKLLAAGITLLITLQALINIGGILNVIPLTGVPLPFISYGGSSLVVSLMSLGLLTNLSREAVND